MDKEFNLGVVPSIINALKRKYDFSISNNDLIATIPINLEDSRYIL